MAVAAESEARGRAVAADVAEAGALFCGLKPDTALYRNLAQVLGHAAAAGGAMGRSRPLSVGHEARAEAHRVGLQLEGHELPVLAVGHSQDSTGFWYRSCRRTTLPAAVQSDGSCRDAEVNVRRCRA